MNVFLIYCIPCGLIGLFFGAMLSAGCKTKAKRAICFVLVALISTSIFAGGFTLEHAGDERKWNGGHCECGGERRLVNVSRYRNTTTYYWECEECLSVIETHTNPR